MYEYTYKQKNIEEVFWSGIDFAESIIKVLGDKEMRERMGRMAKAKKTPEGQEKFLKELLDGDI